MATRATVKVKGIKFAKLYKHWDGHPNHMLPWLKEFNKKFAENRGDDASYKFAQLLRSSVFMQDEFHLDKSDITGYGVVGYYDNCGEEYEYVLHADGTVTFTPFSI